MKSDFIQREYYNKISEVYDLHYTKKESLDYKNKLLEDFLGSKIFDGRIVLDAMCGGGQSTAFFLKKGAKVVGIDISEKQCDKYKQRFPNTQIICGSILSTNLENEKFDYIFTDSLHHLHPNINQGLNELIRLLKPSGTLIIWEPSAGSIFDLARKLWYKLDKTYFASNEKSINLDYIEQTYKKSIKLTEAFYGGNIAYLFVFLSMALRIPAKWVKYYATAFFAIEKKISKYQNKFLCLWVFACFQKYKSNQP